MLAFLLIVLVMPVFVHTGLLLNLVTPAQAVHEPLGRFHLILRHVYA